MIARASRLAAVALVMLAVAWGALALWFDGSASRPIAGALAVGFAAICISLVALIRPLWRGLTLAIAPADLRTDYRGEQVYLYRLRVPGAQARALLVDYLREINGLAEHPKWYNALTSNCTTMIRYHAQNVAAGNPFDWRLLLNGRIDELAYERGQIATSLPFVELRDRSNVTAKARAADDSADFSARISENLPGSHDSKN
jgi:Domain of unknown function (DUF4105)